MKAITVKKNVYWVGVQDPNLRVFDIVMETEYGTSYNSYLIIGSEKTALLETVKSRFFDEYLQDLEKLVSVSKIDYLVLNHTEPDHSGSVNRLLEINPELTVIGSPPAIEFLEEICNCSFKSRAVGQGSKLSLGDKNIQFIGAPLLHWPDSIYSYLAEDKILFTCDSFGSHYSSPQIFDDLIKEDYSTAFKYYFDMIMGPFKPQVIKALDRIKDLDIEIICPGHGPVLRRNLADYLQTYRSWAAPATQKETCPKIVIAYYTAYGYTEQMAQAIVKGLEKAGDFDLKVFNLLDCSLEDVLGEIENAQGLLIGSPTINKDTLPPVWNLLSQLSPIIHHGIVAAAFGAYGWSGEAVPNIEKRLLMLRMNVLPGFRRRFKPSKLQMEEAEGFGADFGKAVLAGDLDLLNQNFINDSSEQPKTPEGDYQKKYENQDIIVYWDPHRCMHDTQCYTRFPHIYDPEARPWVKIDAAPAEVIIRSINRCPSGALKYSLPEGSAVNPELAKGPGLINNSAK
ncbi:MAG: (4Fe-4S)-binding protein [Syntrophomonadaceae bacterium]|nr:(4Fe-4S)-binding protein [Syntrophomonadaceae bacterium]MDD3022714.1 (4Fe-4S)-binding protein [Syntrophomonadaceae bacterium]